MSGKEYTDLNGNSGREYMNSVVALGTLSKKDFEKYKILIMEKFVDLLSRQEFSGADNDSLDIIKGLLGVSSGVTSVLSQGPKSSLDANARSFDGNHLAKISKIKHEDKATSDSILTLSLYIVQGKSIRRLRRNRSRL